ncbi:MAG TPA: MFS transporter, partial [Burkholderiales bacterium]|nr:MFS transporter [Burkholderiales bacterium]
PMSLEFGWGREVFSFAMALQNLVWGALAAFAGSVGDRYGAGRVIAGCGLAYVLGLVAMAYAGTPLGLQLGSGLLLGLALSGTTFGIVLAVVARAAPPARRSTALGIATAAGSLGQFVMLPVTQSLIQAFDWQRALLGLAVLAALIVPLAAALRGRPAAPSGAEQSLGAALGEAWRERSFHLLFWGYFVCGFQLLMFTVHLPAFVTDGGLAPRHGMIALALIGLCNAIGSFAAGWLGGRYSKKHLLALIYVVRAALIGYLLLAPLTPVTLYVFAVGMGFLWLSTVPLTNGLVGQIFGLRYMATLTGIVFFGHQLGSFLGIWLAGTLYDATGSYNGAFMISIGLGVCAALLNLPVDQRPLAVRRAAGAG